MKPTIKAILWDNDGVLVDTEHLYFRATREVLSCVGVDLTRDLYADLFLKQSKGAWHLAAEKGVSPAEIDRLRDERNARYGRLLREEPTVIAGAEETLARLHGQFQMGIVTSSRRDHFEIIHQSTRVLQYIDFVIASGDYRHAKPDPEPYLLGVQRMGRPIDECVVIEDSERGLTAARRAGLKCVMIPNRLTRHSDFFGASCVLDAITEVTPEFLYSL